MANKMKAIVNKTWGISKDHVKYLYENAIKPMILYGAEVWGRKATDTRLKRQLDAIQRPMALYINRAYKTTATRALETIAGLPPLHLEAKTRYNTYNEHRQTIQGERTTSKNLPHPAGKYEDMIQTENTETNNEQDDITIVTDASTDETGRTGIVNVIKNRDGGGNEEIRMYKIKKGMDSLAAEERGVGKALEYIRSKIAEEHWEHKRLTIYTDTKIGLNRLKNNNIQYKHITLIRKDLLKIKTTTNTVKLIWVNRSRLENIQQNINRLATSARDVGEDITLGTNGLKRHIEQDRKRTLSQMWQREWDETHADKTIGKIIPNVGTDRIKLSFKGTQLLTGHGHIRQYYTRFRLRDIQVECDTCNEPETVEHIIHRCRKTSRTEARTKLPRQAENIGQNYPPAIRNRERDTEIIGWVNEWSECMIEDDMDE